MIYINAYFLLIKTLFYSFQNFSKTIQKLTMIKKKSKIQFYLITFILYYFSQKILCVMPGEVTTKLISLYHIICLLVIRFKLNSNLKKLNLSLKNI